jgi:glucose-1-phosphate cytidylyltransferase
MACESDAEGSDEHMKAVILAGGLGTRLSEETVVKPKPMVEVGGKPMLWHIMSIYSAFGVNEFIVALGYKGEFIKRYFLDFNVLNSDLSVDLSTGDVSVRSRQRLPWTVHLVDTGLETQTGGRLKRLAPWLEGEDAFMMTYGDGVANVDISKLEAFHRRHGKLATLTAVRPPARFGGMALDGEAVPQFTEKPQTGEGWINGGFFVLSPRVLEFVDEDSTIWERAPLERIAAAGELMAYRHEGFWQPMDTLREKSLLEREWQGGKAPWKVW